MKSNRFRLTAYSGGAIDYGFWGRTVIDIEGIRLDPKLPALREHDRPCGVIDRHWRRGGTLWAEGYFSSNRDGQELFDLLGENFPLQVSLGLWPELVEVLEPDETAEVNKTKFSGPLTIIRECHCREISFTVLGNAGTGVSTTFQPTQSAARPPKGEIPMSKPRHDHPFMRLVEKIQEEKKCTKAKAMRQAVRENPVVHKAYIMACNA